MAEQNLVTISSCPRCGETHSNLNIINEEKIVVRGAGANMAWIVVICPNKNEEFKIMIKKKS